ncbi:MAG: DNA-processing protein DprA, partial [Muribaculaceae bacterium]|nr:DNA-processing protein DprA [Muribaculaceae bacterium]
RKIVNSSAKIYESSYRSSLLKQAESEFDFINRNNIKPIYYTDSTYPGRLLECDDAPLMLYTLGNCDLNQARMVGIVGTRHATHYGIDFTNRFVDELASLIDNAVIVSGLAYGIDITAHRAAMRNKIPTIAVLAHGLNTIYPADHRKDAADISHIGGMLVTDYRSCDAVHRGNFVARNRIVAGLCDCLVVVESAQKGGALITATIASDYNRDVFAVPGRIYDRFSAGCNKLIASNVAALVESAADVVAAMRWPIRPSHDPVPTLPIELDDDDRRIIDYLTDHDDATINRMTVDLNTPVAQLMSHLIDMEFRGLLTALPGGRYRLKQA